MKHTALWLEDAVFPESLGKAPVPEKVDVLVMGGGYTGLVTALKLAKSGVSVAVIEKHNLGWGASSRNGGKALVGLKPSAAALFKKYGPTQGEALWRASVDGIHLIEEVIKEEKIDCHFERCGSFFGACKPAHFEKMKRESAWLEKNLNYQSQIIQPEEVTEQVGTDTYFGGVVDEKSAGFQPAQYAAGLAVAVQRTGGILCENTEVLSVKKSEGGFRITTSGGEVRAHNVVAATNGYTNGAVRGLSRRVIAIGSYIIATENISEEMQKAISPKGRMFYDSKWFLNYFRITPDGRMLFGGRTSISPNQDLNKSAELLTEEMVRMFPILKGTKVTHSWTGHLGLSFDMLPHIGRERGVYYALGYSGHGVAMSTFLAYELADLILGEKVSTPFMDIKQPTYFFYQGYPWFRPFLNVGLRILDKVT